MLTSDREIFLNSCTVFKRIPHSCLITTELYFYHFSMPNLTKLVNVFSHSVYPDDFI